jgi:pimeloyl-ACP methyl ester carboxylesterase
VRVEPEPDPQPFELDSDGALLSGEASGAGAAVLLLHGLTATRRYIVHGSRALQAGGCRVISYDARGHGESRPAPAPDAYAYPLLAADALAVLDAARVERAVLVGSSMGAATATAVALQYPERVGALVLVTPAHLGRPAQDLARWDALSDGLRRGGVEGFLAAYGRPRVPERNVAAVETVIRQRLSRHRHPGAVADALRFVPRSAAFDGLDALRRIAVPTLIVASRDELDPDHPIAVAVEYERLIPGARLIVEDEGTTPLAWRGSALSAAVLDVVAGLIATSE